MLHRAHVGSGGRRTVSFGARSLRIQGLLGYDYILP